MRRSVSLLSSRATRMCRQRQSTLLSSDNRNKPAEHVAFPSDHAAARDSTRDQAKKSFRPAIDATSTSILLFPGQGAQFVGMGKELLAYKEAMDLFTIASDILKYDLYKICVEGPIEMLNRTEICQLATLVTSVGALVKLRQTKPEILETCVGAAGFSIGEYAALVFAGVLSFEDAIQLVQARALAMQAASDAVPGGMMTVFLKHNSRLKFAMLAAREYCKQRLGIDNPVCSIANYLFPEVKVIAGHMQALEFIKTNYSEFNIQRVKALPVSGAFHTQLMKPAVEDLKKAMSNVQFQRPVLPVHSNVNCEMYNSNWNFVRKLLLDQLYEPVRWEQLMHTLYHRGQGAGFPNTYEVGPGNQLGTILKMVNRKAFMSYSAVEV